MEYDLISYDMEKFLDKYTRFMTKNIYISNKLYTNFIEQYDYLYQTLNKDKDKYIDNKNYKKIKNILENRVGLIRLHNQKYFKASLKEYPLSDKLDLRKKMIVLTEEENTYIVEPKNYDLLVGEKIRYLIDYKGYKESDILVLADSKDKELIIRKYTNYRVDITNIDDYSRGILGSKRIIDDKKKYNIFSNYIMNDLYRDKVMFNSFYKAFSKYIYLNKDYKDFDTFKDYHNYMYKRKYLSSKLSLKKFNEGEIKKRKSYLRTINNEVLLSKELVDIANFFTLNMIEYEVINNTFKLRDKDIIVVYGEYLGGYNTSRDNTIYIDSTNKGNKSYLEVLVYELIKLRYPFALASDNYIYTKLRDSNIDNYFSEFISKYLIPLINYYDNENDLTNINISNEGKEEFLRLYEVYTNYLKANNLITEKELLVRIEEYLNNSKYKYLFLIGDIPINTKINTFTVVSSYKESELIKTNVKLLYDYKKYLYSKQIIPIMHTFTSRKELDRLTKNFLKDNLMIINETLESTTKTIKIYEYDDSNRLHIYNNISNLCSKILGSLEENTIIAFNELKDINNLIGNNNFTKIDKNTCLSKDNIKVDIGEIKALNKMYSNIILPTLIKDSYHDELFIRDYKYNLKVMIYTALNKCRNNLIILCPISRKKEIDEIFKNINIEKN